MSAGIEQFDRGVVWGTTWHGLVQYVQQEYPVTVSQAKQVFDFELEKKQLSLCDSELGVIPVDSYGILRKDTKSVLVAGIGKAFHVISHGDMFDSIQEGLLNQYPDLDIESVGTLRNGATCFVNLKVDDVNIKGDKSQNMCRMMFTNPLGKGCYTVGVHNVRVVCQNTLNMAEAQAAAEGSLCRIRHTAGAPRRINDTLVDLAQVKLGLEAFQEHMNHLVDTPATVDTVNIFLNSFIPVPEDAEGRMKTTRQKKRERILELFEGDQQLAPGASRSLYGLLQAVTYSIDHLPPGSVKNPSQVQWDALTGQRSQDKVLSLEILDALAA